MARLSASAAPLIHYCMSSREIYPFTIPRRPPPYTAECIKGPFFAPSFCLSVCSHLQKDKRTGYAKVKPFQPVSPSVHPLSCTQCQAKQSRSLQDTGLEKKALASGNQEQHPSIRAWAQTQVPGMKRKHWGIRLTAPVNLAVGECPIFFKYIFIILLKGSARDCCSFCPLRLCCCHQAAMPLQQWIFKQGNKYFRAHSSQWEVY